VAEIARLREIALEWRLLAVTVEAVELDAEIGRLLREVGLTLKVERPTPAQEGAFPAL
jgi:hypothetical protein